MSNLSRRKLLIFFGSSAAATALAPNLGHKFLNGAGPAEAASPLGLTPVRLPHPLSIYTEFSSYLPKAPGNGSILPAVADPSLTSYSIIDDVVVPPEYERYVIVRWGDRVFSNPEEYFGYNCDYTGYVPISGDSDVYLWVNHEYNSFPISPFTPEVPSDLASSPSTGPLIVSGFPTTKGLTLYGEFMYNMGGSIVRIKKNAAGRYAVVKDAKNRRIHGLSGLGINATRSDSYKTVTSWGSKSYQQGDQNYLIGTGPAATQVFEAINSDGLGNKIIGTAYNCSGGTTPWGTILTAEENFQGGAGAFFVGVQESVLPTGVQTGYLQGTPDQTPATGTTFGLVGEKYGWMTEIDPADPTWRPRKHTWLGRFRHENITMRVEAGKKLVAYMGDDRRGGHTWKFVSAGTVSSPQSKSNSNLWEQGILYVARFEPNGTGTWIPLLPNTPTNPIPPTVLSSVEFAALGSAQRDGFTRLPRRKGIAGQTVDGGPFNITRANQATTLPPYQNKVLANFYNSLGAILVDAYLAGNLAGGTPTARPEDLEVNPKNPREVFIAYTDGAPGGDGYPDSRIFQVAKLSTAVNATQQSGGLYKIIEDSADSTGLTFKWERLLQGGEDGSVEGDGFANVDNLAFDPAGNIWGVTDMSTSLHNGFNVGAAATPNSIVHNTSGNVSNLVGVFGNNFLFYVPLSGANAGKVVPFAYGPPRCEMTGPTFIKDTLILAVQHPGEDCPFTPNRTLNRDIEMLKLDGTLFTQNRSVPIGSNWPSNVQGDPDGPPRPTVIGIKRKKPTGSFI
jgi:hypothetical protein